MQEPPVPSFAAFPPAFMRDPYPFFQQLRAQSPVHRDTDGRWIVLSHALISSALRDRRFITNDYWTGDRAALRETSAYARMEAPMMIHREPPDHTRLRGLVSRAFTPKLVASLAPAVQRICDDLIDAALERDAVDLMADFAAQLPVMVIAEMLGVPREDHGRFQAWSGDILKATEALLFTAPGDEGSEGLLAQVDAIAVTLRDYFLRLVAERRVTPRDDLLDVLVRAEDEGNRLSEDELVSTAVLLIVAGSDTSMNTLSNSLHALLKHPAQLALLEANPALAENAVEELLRYDCPIQIIPRRASADVELGPVLVSAGEEVLFMVGAANRDPARYADPDTLDLRRENVQPMSFGGGIHYCVGAPLARLEAKIALVTLLRRLPGLSLPEGMSVADLEWNGNVSARGLKALPVTFRRGTPR